MENNIDIRKQHKWKRRDNKRKNRRHGHREDGRTVINIQEEIRKRGEDMENKDGNLS
jgi:hypothetical protein